MEFLSSAMRQVKKKKSQGWKGNVKCIFSHGQNNFLHSKFKKSTYPPKRSKMITKQLIPAVVHKDNIQKSIAFL